MGVIQSMNSVTHSYTLQVYISLAGKMGKLAYLCFQEPTGNFGIRVTVLVKQQLELCKNIFADSSISEKLTKNHIKTWLLKFSLKMLGTRLYCSLIAGEDKQIKIYIKMHLKE